MRVSRISSSIAYTLYIFRYVLTLYWLHIDYWWLAASIYNLLLLSLTRDIIHQMLATGIEYVNDY